MSRLYASIDSDSRKTQATSRGHKNIESHTRGWNVGVQVFGRATDGDRDVFELYATTGSAGGSRKFLGTVTLDENGEPTFEPVTPFQAGEDEGEYVGKHTEDISYKFADDE